MIGSGGHEENKKRTSHRARLGKIHSRKKKGENLVKEGVPWGLDFSRGEKAHQ